MKTHNHYIYTFTDPTTGNVSYVGRSSQPLPKRFVKHMSHLKSGKYVRHPFKCKLQSLYKQGISYETLLESFVVIKTNLSKEDAIVEETKFINEVYGLANLMNIQSDGSGGGDTFSNHPHKGEIRKKYKTRIPWNKGTKGVCKPSKTSFKKDVTRVLYVLISPDSEVFNLLGHEELKSFCNKWKRDHNAISVKDKNWLSPTAFQMGTTLKGWKVKKITVEE